MFYLSVGWLATFLGAAFGAGIIAAEPLMKLYVRFILYRQARATRAATEKPRNDQ